MGPGAIEAPTPTADLGFVSTLETGSGDMDTRVGGLTPNTSSRGLSAMSE
jgi:hypothetical protein